MIKHRPRHRWFLPLATVLVVLLATPCLLEGGPGAFGGGSMKMKGFKTRGTRADGTVEWDLSGEYAVLRGNTADLTDLTLVFHPEKGGAPFVITSPSCVFDRGTNTGGSEAPIRAETDGFTLLGRGYDVDATNQLLHIHSEVEMTVRRKNAAQTKKDGETISPATESGRNSQ